MSWAALGNIFGGSAASSAGGSLPWKGLSMGLGDKTSPSHKLFGNFFTIQDEYEDKRQLSQQQRLNQLMLNAERQSFNQKMALAHEHGIHPLSVLGVPMSSTTVGASSHDYQASPGAGVSLDAGKHQTPELSEHDKAMMEYNERIASANARAAESRAVSDEVEARQRASVLLGQQVGPHRLSNDQIATQSKLSRVPESAIQGPDSIIRIKPSEVTAHSPGDPSVTAAISPALDRAIMKDGSIYNVPNKDQFQVELDSGEMILTLMNEFGQDLGTSIAISALYPILGPAAAGLGLLGYRGLKARRAAKAAELLQKRQAHRRWKGGE